MEIRTLNDGDLPALEELLRPIEAHALLLLGNARNDGIDDRGGPRNGCWLGAFEQSRLVGVAAWFRGFGSLFAVCNGHAASLIPALIERVGKPRVVIGTTAHVAEVLPHVPWQVGVHKRDRLMVLHWPDYAPRPLPVVRTLLLEEAPAAAEAQGALHREAQMPTDPAVNLAGARRCAAEGGIQSVWEEGRLVAISTDAASTGRYVHIGATWCAPQRRRGGYAGACVTAVLDRARAQGRASKGAVLFTGMENVAAQRLYERLGFRHDVDWELAFFA